MSDTGLDIWVDRVLGEHEIAEPGLGRALDALPEVVERLRDEWRKAVHRPTRRGAKKPREDEGFVPASELKAALDDLFDHGRPATVASLAGATGATPEAIEAAIAELEAARNTDAVRAPDPKLGKRLSRAAKRAEEIAANLEQP